jgi:hypothetical protein
MARATQVIAGRSSDALDALTGAAEGADHMIRLEKAIQGILTELCRYRVVSKPLDDKSGTVWWLELLPRFIVPQPAPEQKPTLSFQKPKKPA